MFFIALDTYGRFQCSFNQLVLTCPENQTILLESAYFGLYGYTSTQEDLTCKPPHYTSDCTEPMFTNSPGDWLILQELCNGENSCSYTTQAGLMTSCGEVVGADYTDVRYQCLSGMIESVYIHLGVCSCYPNEIGVIVLGLHEKQVVAFAVSPSISRD